MTMPPFKIGDRVRIKVGSAKGHEFQITEIKDRSLYSTCQLGWYCGHELELVDALQIGDLVEVIGPCGIQYIQQTDDPQIFRITEIGKTTPAMYRAEDSGRPGYPASSLQKICGIRKTSGQTVGEAFQECSDKIEKAVGAIQNIIAPDVYERLAAIEGWQAVQQKTIFDVECAIERLDEVQDSQEEQISAIDEALKNWQDGISQKDDLQIGDWCQIVYPAHSDNGKIFRVAEMVNMGLGVKDATGRYHWSVDCLRKLSIEEIARRLNGAMGGKE